MRAGWAISKTGRVQQIITLEEMIGWHFYENVEDMREWLKRSHKEDNAKIPLIESPPPPKPKARQPPRRVWSTVAATQ